MVSLRHYEIWLLLRLLGVDGTLDNGGFPATHVATYSQNIIGPSFEMSPASIEGSALVPTVAVSDLNGASDAAHEIYEISGEGLLENHSQKDASRTLALTSNSRKRKAEVASSLARHREHLQIMPAEFTWMSLVLDFPREKVDLLRRYGVPTSKKRIPEVVEALRRYRSYILQLVQEKLREWGGVKRRWVTKSTPEKENEEPSQRSLPNLAKESAVCNAVEAQSMNLKYPPQPDLKSQQQASKARHESPQNAAERTSELHEDEIQIISGKVKDVELSDLNELLHSLFFPMNNNGWQTRIETRVSYEKSIFQAINFMFQFELITTERVRKFFLAENTLQVTAIHMKWIFSMGKSFLKDHQAFMPDLNFILTHWKTEHFHYSLKALERKEQGQILFSALKQTIIAFEDNYKNRSREPRSLEIHKYFMNEDSLITLNKWSEGSFSESDGHIGSLNELKKYVSMTIKFFQESSPVVDDGNIMESKRAEYMMSFHILNFMKTYYYEYLKSNITNPVNLDKLVKQIELLRTGLGIHQLFNQLHDYKEFLISDSNQQEPLPAELEQKRRVVLKEELGRLRDDYPSLKQEVSDLAENDLQLEIWLHGDNISEDILEFLDEKSKIFDRKEMKENRNVWMIKRRIFPRRTVRTLVSEI